MNHKLQQQQQQPRESFYDLIIVGAGIAGLSTARLFLEQFPTHRVLIVEARDRVGGRTFAQDVQGYMWDLGGQWLGKKQHRMYKLCERYGLEIFDQYYQGKVVSAPFADGQPLEVFGGADETENQSDASSLSSASSVYPSYVDQYMKDIEQCVQEIDQSEEKRREYDSMSVFEWKEKMYGTEIANKLNTVQGLVCMHPKDVSFLYWLLYVKYGQGLVFLSETNEGGQHHRIKGGSFLFSLKIFEELKANNQNCHFAFSSPVQTIDQESLEHVNMVRIITNNGLVANATRVVVTIPPLLVSEIHFIPELPKHKQVLYDNFPMGHVIKCLVFYDKPWWREENYSGISLTNNRRFGVGLTYDASLEFADLKQYALVAFFLGNGAKEWTEKTEEERLQHCCDCFAYFFNNKEAARYSNVKRYVEKDWNKEKYSGGAYVGHLPPKVLTRVGGEHVIRESVGRVHFAGTETATYFVGYMEGAVQSAERVVSELKECYSTRILSRL